MTTSTLEKFDLNNLHKNPIIFIIGRRATGKSTLIKDLYNHYNPDISMVFSGGENSKLFYDKICKPKDIIREKYNDDLVSDLIPRTREETKKLRCLITENVIQGYSEVKDAKFYKDFIYNSRSYNTIFISGVQMSLGMGDNLRSNIDYTFIAKTISATEIDRLHKQYAFPDMTRSEFSDILEQATREKYAFLVIDHIKNKMYTYKVNVKETSNGGFFSRIWRYLLG